MQLSPHFKLEEFLRSEVAARMGRPITIDDPQIQTNLDVGPIFSIDDVADDCRTNTKFLGDPALNGTRSDSFANISHCAFSKLRRPIECAARSVQTAMRSGIRGIRFQCIPSKVRETIVEWYVVVVTSCMSFWTWANKSLQYKPMNSCISSDIILMQLCFNIASLVDVRTQQATASARTASTPKSSEIAYLIESLISDNWKPTFNHNLDYI